MSMFGRAPQMHVSANATYNVMKYLCQPKAAPQHSNVGIAAQGIILPSFNHAFQAIVSAVLSIAGVTHMHCFCKWQRLCRTSHSEQQSYQFPRVQDCSTELSCVDCPKCVSAPQLLFRTAPCYTAEAHSQLLNTAALGVLGCELSLPHNVVVLIKGLLVQPGVQHLLNALLVALLCIECGA